jgi:predicted nuclease of predicted toxin-antitoxin system
MVTKDSDFRDSHLFTGHPTKLPVVATGNNANDAFFELVGLALAPVVAALEEVDFVELRPDELVLHSRALE